MGATLTGLISTVPGSAKPKGKPRGGSRKGIPNKATAKAKEALARLVDGNAGRMQEWLDQIAEQEGPRAAWNCLMDAMEYHVPKLSRAEIAATVVSKPWTPEQADDAVEEAILAAQDR